jgi:hypothetical protein
MVLEDPKAAEVEISNEPIIPTTQNYQNVSMCLSYESSFNQAGLFSSEKGLQLTLESKSYYEEQIKMLEMKRLWHVHNAQQLSAQLLNEKQSI